MEGVNWPSYKYFASTSIFTVFVITFKMDNTSQFMYLKAMDMLHPSPLHTVEKLRKQGSSELLLLILQLFLAHMIHTHMA